MDDKTKYTVPALLFGAVLLAFAAGKRSTQSGLSLPGQTNYVIEGFPIENHITFFGPNNSLKDLGYLQNDAGKSEWDIWSAARIITEVEKVTPYNVDDTSQPSPTVLWSSEKIAESFKNSLIDDLTSSKNLTWSSANIDAKLNAIINDSQTSPLQTWSSQQISDALNSASNATTSIDDSVTSPVSTWSSSKLDSVLKNTADDSITSPFTSWSSQKVSGLLSSALQTISPNVPGDIPTITASGSLVDSGYRLDDTVTSTKTLWSSSAVTNALSSKIDAVPASSLNELVEFDGNGGILASGVIIQDNQGPSSSVLWTSDKVHAMSLGKQNIVSEASPGNVAFYDATGQVTDKGIFLDDGKTTRSNLWTSQKISDEFSKTQSLASPSSNNHVAIFDITGQVVDSGISVDDIGAPSSSVLWSSTKTADLVKGKQSLVPSAQPNNLAAFDGLGQVRDSFVGVDDKKYPSASVLWTSLKIDQLAGQKQSLVPTANSGNLASFDQTGQVQDSGLLFSDDSGASPNVVWSSDKITKTMTAIPTFGGNLASLDLAGKITDSTKRIDDTSVPSSDVLWTSRKMSETLTNAPFQKLGSLAKGSVLIFDASGQAVESDIKFDDSIVSLSTAWSSEKMSNTFQNKITPKTPGNLGILDATGQVLDSGFSVNNESAPTSLWSGLKIATELEAKQNYVQNPVAGNFVSTNDKGQTVDSAFFVDDNGKGSNVLWSSDKIASSQGIGLPGNVGIISNSGIGFVDSGIKIDDNAPASSNILWTSQKMQKSSIDDTVISPSSVWSSEQTALAVQNMSSTKMELVPSAPLASVATFSPGGQVKSSGFVIDDTAVSASALWSSLKTDATYQKIISGAIANTIPTLNSSGQIQSSPYSFSDSVTSPNTINSSKYIFDNYVSKKADVINAGAYTVFDGHRFGIRQTNNARGLTLQTDGVETGVWAYSAVLRGSSYITALSQFVVKSTVETEVSPTFTLLPADLVNVILRFDSKKMYRVTYVIGSNFMGNFITIEKLM